MPHPLKLEVIKEYMRIDGPEDDRLLKMLDTAAEAYMINGGVLAAPSDFEFLKDGAMEENIGLYVLARLMLISHWYENRIVMTPAMSRGSSIPLPIGLDAIMLQLRLREVEPWPTDPEITQLTLDNVSPS